MCTIILLIEHTPKISYQENLTGKFHENPEIYFEQPEFLPDDSHAMQELELSIGEIAYRKSGILAHDNATGEAYDQRSLAEAKYLEFRG